MTMPKRFSENFIGKLLAMRDEYTRADNEWHLLNTAIRQCRAVNEGAVTFPEIHHLWMLGTQKHLARLGVVVG